MNKPVKDNDVRVRTQEINRYAPFKIPTTATIIKMVFTMSFLNTAVVRRETMLENAIESRKIEKLSYRH